MLERLALAILVAGAAGAATAQTPAERLNAMQAIMPPWQHGDGSETTARGLEFTVPPVDVLADFHGSLDNPQLVLFASGNYFFALGRAVGRAYPQYRGRVLYETLPPVLLIKQIEAGGTVTTGNMTFTVKPDVYLAERTASEELRADIDVRPSLALRYPCCLIYPRHPPRNTDHSAKLGRRS
jgi:molybdate transport system substrate-binding protein